MSSTNTGVRGISVPAQSKSPTALSPLSRHDALSRMRLSRLIGSLFIAGFITYGAGAVLTTSVTGETDRLAAVSAHQFALALGAVLILANTAVDLGKAVMIFPLLSGYSRRVALTYLVTMVFEVTLLAIGALFLLMLVPLSDSSAAATSSTWAPTLANLAVDGNDLAYQIAQAALGYGAIFVCVLLLRTRLIPPILAGLGVVGYAFHAMGATAELFGLHISLFMLIPGGVFELTFAVWLLVKGFAPKPYADAMRLTTEAAR